MFVIFKGLSIKQIIQFFGRWETDFKLLNQQFQYGFTQMSGFSLIWIKNSHELKIFELWWIMGKQKVLAWKCFDWMKLIHCYRLVNKGWLADINLFDSMIFTCLTIICKNENTMGGHGYIIIASEAEKIELLWSWKHINCYDQCDRITSKYSLHCLFLDF